MNLDDLEFAFERHATSKIRIAEDLETVKSMGFRGEALASIAAIAKIEMISKTEKSEVGNKITIEAGKNIKTEEIAAQTGTNILIKDLFFNTPVRYKFLKKDFTEMGYIEDIVTRIALANPNISIKLINDNKTIIQTSGNGELRDVIYSIYGKDLTDGLLDVNYEYEDIKVTGVIGKPEIARNNRTYQMFFTNKRYIKDKTLSAAADQAFKGLLPIGKFGVIILNLEIDPKKIDVNVHPTKLEIRFQEEQKVFKALYHGIKDSLLKGDLIKNIEKQEEIEIEEPELVKEQELEEKNVGADASVKPQIKVNNTQPNIKIPNFINLFKKKEKTNEKEEEFITRNEDNTIELLYQQKNNMEMDFELPNENVKIPTEEQLDNMNNILNMQKAMENSEISEEEKKCFEEMYVKTFGKLPNDETEKEKIELNDYKIEEGEKSSIFEKEENYEMTPNYKYIGTIFSTYIVIETKNDAYIIDQHAAHERIMYEKVKQNFYNNKGKDSQIMLLPDVITLSHKERDIVKENSELFEQAGFIYEDFGDNTIKLIGVPNICMELDTKKLFLEILDEIDTVAITAKQEKEEKFIATIACKSAVKANMNLNKEEIDNLITELLKLPNPFTCPHGRPTAIKMNKIDIEKKFNRR